MKRLLTIIFAIIIITINSNNVLALTVNEENISMNISQEKREQLGSRLGFIMLSAGCAIGCGNVWKFPWMCGQNGGGSFMLVYVICLLILGLPAMVMELSVGRAAQTSPLYMYEKLSGKRKWKIPGIVCLIGNIALIAFYSVVAGWIIYYFVKFLTGQNADLGFEKMITTPSINVGYLLITVVITFVILSFRLQGGLERITKYMMSALLVLMLVLAIHSFTLSGAKAAEQAAMAGKPEGKEAARA